MAKLLSLLVAVSGVVCISECQQQPQYYYQTRTRPTLVHFPTSARTSTIRFPQRQQQRLRASLPNEYNSYGFESPNSINYDRQQRVVNSNALGNHNNNNNILQPASNNKECVCPCTREYLPICASDRKSYGNRCLFECEQKCNPVLRFRHCGTCEEPDSNQSCL